MDVKLRLKLLKNLQLTCYRKAIKFMLSPG
jgi:hypothetical protein